MKKVLEVRFLENDEVEFEVYIFPLLDKIDFQLLEKAIETILLSFSLIVKPDGIERISVFLQEDSPKVEIVGNSPFKDKWTLLGYTMFTFLETINYFVFKSYVKTCIEKKNKN